MATSRRSTPKKPTPTGKQRAATPSPPKPQRAATPRQGSARKGPARAPRAPARVQVPVDLVEHFGGQERLDLIHTECVPHDASPADELRLLLEARRLGADPLRRDVYLARGVSRDGSAFVYSVAAKRDALLAYAERQPSFRGFDADAVYASDHFERVAPTSEGTLRERGGVVHLRDKKALATTDAAPALVKAWCVVDREGRPPLVFEALALEYLPAEEVAAMEPDDPRRRYPDRYLVKAAMCWPLRMAFGLNDVVGAEELPARPPVPQAEPEPDPLAATDDLGRRIAGLFAAAKRVSPALWPAGKVRARLQGAIAADAVAEFPDEHRRALAEDMAASVIPRLEARHAELLGFDREGLDDETLEELADEIAGVEEALHLAGVDAARVAA